VDCRKVRLGQLGHADAALRDLSMLVMLRHAVLLRAKAVILTGALAVATLTSFALSLDHDLDATVMILVWNLGAATLISGIGGLPGRRMFLCVA
jgi:hypothetical protein